MKKVLKYIGNIFLTLAPTAASIVLGALLVIPVMIYYYGIIDLFSVFNFSDKSIDSLMVVNTVWTIFSAALAYYWLRKVRKKYPQEKNVPLKKSINFFSVTGTILTVIGAQLIVCYVMFSVQRFSSFDLNTIIDSQIASSDFATTLLVVSAICIAPIHEEILFRGLTLHFAKRLGPFWVANIIQALLFAVLHMNLTQGVYVFFLGLILGYVYKKTGNLKAPMWIHFLFNILGSIQLFSPTPVYKTSSLMVVLFVSAILLASGIILFSTGIKLKQSEE